VKRARAYIFLVLNSFLLEIQDLQLQPCHPRPKVGIV
jgi:hypothetical protein